MRKLFFTVCILALTAVVCSTVLAKAGDKEKKLTISYTWNRIQSRGSNQIAIWIEDKSGNHICTLFATKFTASGGYTYRPTSLSEWVSKFGLKDAPKETVDAITGSTPQTGKQVVYWNGKDQSGKAVAAGTYIVRMEANIYGADRMFFRGEVKIGGDNQKTTGEITFSKPELASGNVLFSDVVVEYN